MEFTVDTYIDATKHEQLSEAEKLAPGRFRLGDFAGLTPHEQLLKRLAILELRGSYASSPVPPVPAVVTF